MSYHLVKNNVNISFIEIIFLCLIKICTFIYKLDIDRIYLNDLCSCCSITAVIHDDTESNIPIGTLIFSLAEQ